ncbi:hypothetical protein Pan97_04360 [Bremerella volcania]|uniref:Carboxypeptidase regulatory-like domain-containing protein n=1 Tax=Bremerella volcania TaxID=2527984 RepID=A0A518C2R0_9BACT|nr:hypothetical protein [Bremerella volcania]QDU73464.1 hypothetical protein Pan97_04360 [Bremerella volcania]
MYKKHLISLSNFVVLLASLSFLAGCSASDGMITISGSVTLDGEPVQDGSISLMPINGGSMGGGLIENGHYTAKSSPGEMAVQIHAHKMVPKKNPTREEVERGLTEDSVSIIPAVYNRQSELRITVAPDQKNFEFQLTKDGKIPEGMAKM